MKVKPLGATQRGVLRALADHGGWPTGGWYWGNISTTRRVLDSLVKRGLASRDGDTYRITSHGREEVS